ncbi:MAG: fluoride efflux transporter CrcB [Alistipes sp.]|nr:fluoride efflux transporter CrcB [Alistipes sp.]
MWQSILVVGMGSFCGGALRYWISTLMRTACGTAFPWATLSVNLLGCLALGVVMGLFGRFNATGSAWCLLLATGFCGGFTTFSTFANESLQLLQGGQLWPFVGYIALSLLGGLLLAATGYCLVR